MISFRTGFKNNPTDHGRKETKIVYLAQTYIFFCILLKHYNQILAQKAKYRINMNIYCRRI